MELITSILAFATISGALQQFCNILTVLLGINQLVTLPSSVINASSLPTWTYFELDNFVNVWRTSSSLLEYMCGIKLIISNFLLSLTKSVK